MFAKSLNYLKGYVVAGVSGFAVERFLNLAARRGINIWDVKNSGAYTEIKISAKAFGLLGPCAEKTGSRIEILSRRGLPFIARRYRKRKLLAVGAVFFVAALYFLSSFIWRVDVEGAKRLNGEEIAVFLSERGLRFGAFKKNVSDRALEKELLLNFGDISWVNVEIRGTRALISLTETIPETALADRTTPCDIIAEKDGLIVSMATSSGTPKFKAGDTVKKGELLVSSETLVGTEDAGYTKKYVRANSFVRAKVFLETEIFVPFKHIEKKYTGNIKKKYSIIAFGKEIKIFNSGIPYANYDKITTVAQLGFGKDHPVPLTVVTREYREFFEAELERTPAKAKEFGLELLEKKLSGEFGEAEISGRRIDFEETVDGVKLFAAVTVIERIDVSVPLNEDFGGEFNQ